MPRCCPECWQYHECGDQNGCCSGCYYYSNGECRHGEGDHEDLEEPY